MRLMTLQLPKGRPVAVGNVTELWVPTVEDYEFVYQLRAQRDVHPWFGDPSRWSREQMIAELRKYAESATDTLLLIRHTRTGERVGFLGCREPMEEIGAITVGRLAIDKPTLRRLRREGSIVIDEARRWVLDATAAMLQFLFEEGEVLVARVHAYPENKPSLAVIGALGFREVGSEGPVNGRATRYFELTVEEWRVENGAGGKMGAGVNT